MAVHGRRKPEVFVRFEHSRPSGKVVTVASVLWKHVAEVQLLVSRPIFNGDDGVMVAQ